MKNRKEKDDSINYDGEIHLRLEYVKNFTQVDRFCQDLETITCLDIVARTWSEKKGLEISIMLREPVPLLDKLREMTPVEKVFRTKKRILTVVINNYLGGTTSPLISPSDNRSFS